MIVTEGLTKPYKRVIALEIVVAGGSSWRGVRAAGSQRLGEDDDDSAVAWALAADVRPGDGRGIRLLAEQSRRPAAGVLPAGRVEDVWSRCPDWGHSGCLCDLRDGAGLDRAVAIAERVMKLNLRRKLRTYSTGMKQKLALAQVFSDPVDTLILDEPTSALDPSARSIVMGLVQEARSGGQTVIFSGHVLAEVEQVADRVAIMRKGRLMHVEDMHARRRLRMLLDPICRRN